MYIFCQTRFFLNSIHLIYIYIYMYKFKYIYIYICMSICICMCNYFACLSFILYYKQFIAITSFSSFAFLFRRWAAVRTATLISWCTFIFALPTNQHFADLLAVCLIVNCIWLINYYAQDLCTVTRNQKSQNTYYSHTYIHISGKLIWIHKYVCVKMQSESLICKYLSIKRVK